MRKKVNGGSLSLSNSKSFPKSCKTNLSLILKIVLSTNQPVSQAVSSMEFRQRTNLKRKSEFKRSQYLIWKEEASEKQKVKREEIKKLAQQNVFDKKEITIKIADEACVRIMNLPQELQIHILHHLEVKQLQLLQLPPLTLRAVLQVQERNDSHAKELIKSTWLPGYLTRMTSLLC